MPSCERDALIATVDAYLDALVHRDPGQLPLAPDIRFTENCQVIEVGQALWATVSGARSFRLTFADCGGRDVGCYTVLEEMGHPVILSVRLRVVDGLITEIEHLVGRDPAHGAGGHYLFDPGALNEVEPIFDTLVAPKRRVPRERLIEIADSYYTAIECGVGKIVPVLDDCVRRENGVYTALNPAFAPTAMSLSVFDGIDVGSYVGLKVRSRRFPVVDEERCLVWSINFFESPGNIWRRKVRGLGELPTPSRSRQPCAETIAELFKVVDGKIHRIETVLGPRLPFGAQWNWD
jgi:hypothetical protein